MEETVKDEGKKIKRKEQNMKFDVEKFRNDCKISDTKRDAGLTTPDNILRYNDISYAK